jgi:hypothetical protein
MRLHKIQDIRARVIDLLGLMSSCKEELDRNRYNTYSELLRDLQKHCDHP